MREVWFFTSELEGERAGSFRQERWCRLFLARGHRITVFNILGASRLMVAQFETIEGFNEFRRKKLSTAKLRASVREGLLARLLRHLKHISLVDLFLPNIVLLAARASWRAACAGEPIILMASSPPFSTALAGAIVKSLQPRKIVLAVDMRDAWALHRSLGGVRPLKRTIEGWVLRTADHVSTVSFGLKDEFEETYDLRARALYNVATHYFSIPEPQKFVWGDLNAKIRDESFKIIYTGSTPVGFYDIPTMVEAVAALRVSNPDVADRFQFIFVGACDEIAREATRHDGIGDDIVFVPHVMHALAQAIQLRADALLFLGYYGVGVVSTKIFEYLALGRPILPLFVTSDSDVDRLLKRYGDVTCNLFSAQDIIEKLLLVATSGPKGILPQSSDPNAVRTLLDDYSDYADELSST